MNERYTFKQWLVVLAAMLLAVIAVLGAQAVGDRQVCDDRPDICVERPALNAP